MDRELVEKSVGALFPAGCEVTRRAGEAAPDARFWVIPGRHEPRWIVPQTAKWGWPMLAQWRPYDALSRAKWSLLTTAYRAGRLGDVPGITGLGVAGAETADWAHLGWRGDDTPAPVIYIGTPGATRKAIAALVDRTTRRAESIAKAPLGPRAAERIRHEADVLERLEGEKPGLAPRLLHRDPTRSVQTAISGRPSAARLDEAHAAWLDRLRLTDVETSIAAEAEALARRLDALDRIDGATRTRLQTALATLTRRESLPAVWIHGDFTPWNLKWSGPRRLAAFDWEFAEPRGLPGHDAAHFLCRVIVAKETTAGNGQRLENKVLDALAAQRLAGAEARDVWRLYVVWYLVVLLENDIADPYGALFEGLVRRWKDEPL